MTLDISAQVTQLCAEAALKPTDVAEIRILPTSIEFRAFALNENGEKFVEPSGTVAMRHYEFRAKTW